MWDVSKVEKNYLFTELANDSDLNAADIFSEDIPNFTKEYLGFFKLSVAPFLLSEGLTKSFDKFCKNFTKITQKTLVHYALNTPSQLSSYLNVSEDFIRLISEFELFPNDLVLRHDVVFKNDQIKAIEINSGLEVGGWELDWGAKIFEDSIRSSRLEPKVSKAVGHVVTEMFKSVYQTIATRLEDNCTGNILLFTASQDSSVYTDLESVFEILANDAKATIFPNAKLLWCRDPSAIDFRTGRTYRPVHS
jgi:hypothetical protein